jgi:hypothetical protein
MSAPSTTTTGALPPTAVNGESADEYRWRVDAEQRRTEAQSLLEQATRAINQGQIANDSDLRWVEQRIEQADQLLVDSGSSMDEYVKARGVALAESATAMPRANHTEATSVNASSNGGTEANWVAVLGALAGLVAAVAGLITALATWIKNRHGQSSTVATAQN